MTFEQIAQVLETPLGGYEHYYDTDVVRERRRIQQYYSELKNEMGYGEASLKARAKWLYDAQQRGEFPC